ncbi:hypothetical protein J6E39_04725 [bacterium]|nr:hypothetical protein [bacterium]
MKEIYVNAYTKKDGTHVKEHIRRIDGTIGSFAPVEKDTDWGIIKELPEEDNKFGIMYANGGGGFSGDVLTGGISMLDFDIPTTGTVIIDAALITAGVAIKLAPIALEMYNAVQTANAEALAKLKPQFNASVNQLETTQSIVKSKLDKKLEIINSTKDPQEYSRLYNSLAPEYDAYQKSMNSINKMKFAAENDNYEVVMNELDNYQNLQNNIIKTQPTTPANQSLTAKNINYTSYQNPYTQSPITQNQSPFPGANPSSGVSASFPEKVTSFDKTLKYAFQHIPIEKASTTNLKNALNNFDLARKDEQVILLNSLQDIKNQQIYNLMKNLGVPETSKGLVYSCDSKISQEIAKSNTLKKYIINNYNKLRNGNIGLDQIEFGTIYDPDLHLAFQHVTLLNPQIDNAGTFSTYIIDYYDFNYRDMPDSIIGKFKTYINNWGYKMQENDLLENYFILLYIKFEVNQI